MLEIIHISANKSEILAADFNRIRLFDWIVQWIQKLLLIQNKLFKLVRKDCLNIADYLQDKIVWTNLLMIWLEFRLSLSYLSSTANRWLDIKFATPFPSDPSHE